jgi:hypothetical protein
MKQKFITKLLLFFAITTLITSCFVGGAIYIGDAMPLQLVVDMQQNQELLIFSAKAQTEDMFIYKMLSLATRQPDVVIIGSSSVLQFRSMLLNENPETFYNAGSTSWTLGEITCYVQNMESIHVPRVLIIGLDQNWFSEESRIVDCPETNRATVDFNYLMRWTKFTWISNLAHPISPSRLIRRRDPITGSAALGIYAIRSGGGYRNDGSLHLGNIRNAEFNCKNWTREVSSGSTEYEIETHISQNLIHLDRILYSAQENGVFVIGFSPPVMSTLHDYMIETGGWGFMDHTTESIKDMFPNYGFEYFDFPNAAWIANDIEMYDCNHSGEQLSTRIYIEFLGDLPDMLGEYSDLEYLQQVVDNADNPFDIWSDTP